MIAIVVARTPNRVIGSGGDMPWGRSIKADLRRFRQLTSHHAVIMGSRTFGSLGRALPNRQNIVLTSRQLDLPEGVQAAKSLKEALAAVEPGRQAFLIGGASVYQEGLQAADTIFETLVEHEFAGDTFFPELPPGWQLEEDRPYEPGEDTPYRLRFRRYLRRTDG